MKTIPSTLLLGFLLAGATQSCVCPGRAPAEPARLTVSGVNLEMIRVNPGTFTMGAEADASNRRPDRKPHRVTISRSYYLGRFPVTQEQWRAVMGDAPSHFSGEANLPVENVSWFEAGAFCEKLTEMARRSGAIPDGWAFALPTEAQWEYACRAGTTGGHYGDLDTVAWNEHNAGRRTHPVGLKPANAWGFHDMLGNVWEWCADGYAPYTGDAATDPRGPADAKERAFRGGCWNHADPFCTADFRHHRPPQHKLGDLGFRVALVRAAPSAAPVRAPAKSATPAGPPPSNAPVTGAPNGTTMATVIPLSPQ